MNRVVLEHIILSSFECAIITAGLVAISAFLITTSKIYEFQRAIGKFFILFFIVLWLLNFKTVYSIHLSTNLINNSLKFDLTSVVVKFILCGFSFLFFYLIHNSLKSYKITSFEYYLILLFSISGFMMLCSSNDLVISYVSLELSSLGLYVLSAFRKKLNKSVDAGIKYFVTGALSSSFFLLGSSLIYQSQGTFIFSDFLHFSNLSFLNIELFNYACYLGLGLSIFLFGLSIKLGLAPFHLWSLDVYEGAPISSTLFFASITKISIFVLMSRLFYESFGKCSVTWQSYVITLGVFSVFVGTFGGVMERRFKTLFTYSSTSNIGFAFVVFSSNSFLAVAASLTYLLLYLISSFSVWASLFFLRSHKLLFNRTRHSDLATFGLLKKANKVTAFLVSLAMFSLAGIPPMLGFFSKLLIFINIMRDEFFLLSVPLIIFSVMSTLYYLRVIKCIYFENLLVGSLYKVVHLNEAYIFSFIKIFGFLVLVLTGNFVFIAVSVFVPSMFF